MNRDMLADIGDEAAIWRYMDLPRFVSMLATKALWFAKTAQLHDDPYEGYCQVKPRPFPADEHGSGPLTLENTGGKPVGISLERFAAELSHFSVDYFENARELLFVNSWCLADESMAMWQIYGSSGFGIAVKSTIGRYKRALKLPETGSQFAFGRVEYHAEMTQLAELQVDLTGSAIPMPGSGVWERILKLAFHKRICFEYEREWRGALYQDMRPEPGCNIEFDLEELINDVYVGPRAEPFFVEVVESVMDKYGLENRLKRSALLQPPAGKTSAIAECS